MDRKLTIFALLLAAALGGIIIAAHLIAASQGVVLVVILILAALIYVASKFKILVELKEYERAVVFRFGRFVGVKGPGWVIVIPFIEKARIVDLRTKTLDVAPQKVITKDKIEITIDAVIYLRVKDPAAAVLNVRDFERAAVLYVESELREVVGNMSMEEVISNVDKINRKLKEDLQVVAKDWGVEIVSVEIKTITLPEGLMEAMHKRREAEQRKEAVRQQAEAERLRIEAVKAAAEGLSDKALAYYYIRALEQIAAGKSTKIVLPLDLTTLARAISNALGGAVSPEKVKADLEGKYSYILKEFERLLKEKGK